jgi:hypothetical protein
VEGECGPPHFRALKLARNKAHAEVGLQVGCILGVFKVVGSVPTSGNSRGIAPDVFVALGFEEAIAETGVVEVLQQQVLVPREVYIGK